MPPTLHRSIDSTAAFEDTRTRRATIREDDSN
jgi:hypothetical protein